MARIHDLSCAIVADLSEGWRMAVTDSPDRPGITATWLDAPVPGTAAQALEKTAKNDVELSASLQSKHVWYHRTMPPGPGRTLRFHGLAPHCDIYLGDERVETARHMFEAVEIDLPKNREITNLYLHFLPYDDPVPAARPRRQRWRPHLIAGPHLRNACTALIGHMPGWCPAVPPVGPYRRIEVAENRAVTARNARVRTALSGTVGKVEISIEINGLGGPLVASCWGSACALESAADGRWQGHLTIQNPPLWWPHTHGDPHLLPLTLHGADADGQPVEISLGFVGFRTLELDRGTDGNGFGLVVNGVPIFCRGANWVPDIHLAATSEAYEPSLRRMRDAGMNMLRISGIMGRAAPELFELCDKLGILISQDEPFANFDYDFDSLRAALRIDDALRQFLCDVETSPSLAIVTGGSEMAQQAAMLSLPESVWNLDAYGEHLTGVVHAIRPDVIVVPNSPYGGALPFQPDTGISHYFGVGAYCRPLDDARRARVRFATECLAFANLPQPERLAMHAGGARPGTPDWTSRVVRDLKADWDFEDTRDFYLGILYGVDPAALKRDDPERYLALSYAVPGEVMEATFAEWRRKGSETAGALVWFNRDIAPGFGWGVVDAGDRPKPPWFALKRAFKPRTVMMTDEGLNGLHCHLINEMRHPQQVNLTLTAFAEDGSVVLDGARALELAPRSTAMLTSAELFGIFFDVTYAYRFGPPAHCITVARLTNAQGELIAEAFHFPLGRGHSIAATGLDLRLESDGERHHHLYLTSKRLTQSVHIAADGFEPEDDWFHLAPGEGRRVRLKGRGHPRGRVTAVNTAEVLTFGEEVLGPLA